MGQTRQEKDSMGIMEVPMDCYWGAQTQRSLLHFAIGKDVMPLEVIAAMAQLKKAVAIVNCDLGLLPKDKANLIIAVADEILAGKHDGQFPLSLWQTGSGTQSNMNVNEVISNRANELAGKPLTGPKEVHPNDHVNLLQSSNDVFPSAMYIASTQALVNELLPCLTALRDSLAKKVEEFKEIIKIGRTHLQDAVPMTLGQEFSGYVAQLDDAITNIKATLPGLSQLAIGGTAIGTGLSTHPEFADRVIQQISKQTGLPFKSAPNKFAVIAAHDALVFASGALKTLAAALLKIANDIRWLGSGPRCGLGELTLPENEPGSSIMPGKINPTQCEAMIMICIQVCANDVAITQAGALGNFELNALKPVMIFNFLGSTSLLTDGCDSFNKYLVKDLKANKKKIDYYVKNSLMLVTALSPKIGYDKAAQIAHKALHEEKSLREACIELGYLSGEEFDRIVKPENMLGNIS